MITRGLQRIHTGPQSWSDASPVLFNTLVQSWTISKTTYPEITYNPNDVDGVFCIPITSRSDYLITWTIAFKTTTTVFGFKHNYLFDMHYGNGTVTEGCFSALNKTTGLLQGIKMLHVTRVDQTNGDKLKFSLKMNLPIPLPAFSYLAIPSTAGTYTGNIASASICIIGL